MTSKPIVYVNRISNLSDARYCAGMGADILGFVVTPGHEDYVSSVQFHEILGWVSGPRRVAEIIDWENANLEEIRAQYKPDLFHISIKNIPTRRLPAFPMILELSPKIWQLVQNNIVDYSNIEYIVFSEIPDGSITMGSNYPFLVPASSDESFTLEIQNKTGASGFMLQGSRELQPGLKDYDHLSKILEALDS